MSGQTHPSVHEFEVLQNEEVAPDIFRMRILAPDLSTAIAAGQFINIRVPDDASELLRVPLSFCRTQHGTIELLYAVVGDGTRRLSLMKEADKSDAVGPLGQGWSIPSQAERILLVSGGVGLSPILAAAELLVENNVGFDVVIGASTAKLLWQEGIDRMRSAALSRSCDCARRVYITTDDGSAGIAGFVTEAASKLLDEREYTAIWSCGPESMMRAVAALAQDNHTDCFVSLERIMGCGFGVCAGCNVELADASYALCCSDGPVFDVRELAW